VLLAAGLLLLLPAAFPGPIRLAPTLQGLAMALQLQLLIFPGEARQQLRIGSQGPLQRDVGLQAEPAEPGLAAGQAFNLLPHRRLLAAAAAQQGS